MIDAELMERLQELIKQWNIAEGRIKQAENIRAQEIVSSAIFELRYAGRKIIDSISLSLATDLNADPKARDQVRAYIEDAIEDCIKAKHDAIDAALSFVTRWFAEQEQRLGLKHLQQFYPNYLEITAKIVEIHEKVEESRQNRTTKRDSIYADIDTQGYDLILKLYKEMSLSRDRVERTIRNEKLKDKFMLWLAIAGGIGVLITIFDIAFH